MKPLIAAETRFITLWAQDDGACLGARVRVVKALGKICRTLRLGICSHLGLDENDYQPVTSLIPKYAGRDKRTLDGFERGTSNPTRLDDVVLGYSRASGISVPEIWKRAIKLAEEEAPPPEDELLAAIPSPPPEQPGSVRRKPSRRSRGAGS